MKVKAVSNDINLLPRQFRKYAYGQDEKGIVIDDIVIGRTYNIYGYRRIDDEVFYLIERSAPNWLWWMPARLYEPNSAEVKKSLPTQWVEIDIESDIESKSKDTIISSQLYHDNSQDIEDYTEKGQEVVTRIKLQ
jgi:hypothetical protein